MFPSFIGILDIQSWWEVPSIAHFCSLFRAAFNLLDFDIEELEEALLTDGSEESASSLLTELIVRLLCGCLGNNDISAFNYQMFLRRLFRQKCQETGRYNPFNTDIDFQFLPLRSKVEILYALCDFRLDADDVFELFKNLEAESLRVEPLGWDDNSSAYWYFYGTRLYREDYKVKSKGKKRKHKEGRRRKKSFGNEFFDEDNTERIWQVVCFTEADWSHLTEKFKSASSRVEKELYQSLSQNFLPEIPRLFQEKERLQRKRLLELAPRRTSSRVLQKIKQKEEETREEEELTEVSEQEVKKEQSIGRENRARRRDQLRTASVSSESSETSTVESEKKMSQRGAKRVKTSKNSDKKSKNSFTTDKGEPPPSIPDPPIKTGGRKTNNSLACATGQIVIPDCVEPVHTTRKKLKTSQIFGKTEEDIQTDMYKVLEQLKGHDDAWPFMDPVEEEYAPNYYTVIRRPMDLNRMEDRLDNGHYTDFSMFKADFKLIVNNCRLYNGQDNEYTKMVDNLQVAFERLTERYMDRMSSSDEEIAVEFQIPTPSRKHKIKHSKEPSPERKKKKRRLHEEEGDKKVVKEKRRRKETNDREDDTEEEVARPKSKKPKEEPREEVQEQPKDENDEKVEERTPDTKKNKSKHSKKGHRHGKHSKSHKRQSSRNKDGNSDLRKKSRHSKKIKHGTKHKGSKKHRGSKKKGKHSSKHSKTKKLKRIASQESLESSNRSRSASPLPSIHSPTPSPQPAIEKLNDSDFYKDKYDKIKERRRQTVKEGWDTLSESKPKHIDKQKQNLTMPEKDKNQKLRETIEKLKAKNEKYKESTIFDNLFGGRDQEKNATENDASTTEKKDKPTEEPIDEYEFIDDDVEDSSNSQLSKKGVNGQDKKPPKKQSAAKNESATEALEQAVKDISKWLDDTPKVVEFSPSNDSPIPSSSLDDPDSSNTRNDDDSSNQTEKSLRKDGGRKKVTNKDKDSQKAPKRREIQRTIDRLQPGKSKGNLLTNVPTPPRMEEVVPLGPHNKPRDIKSLLVMKSGESSPRLSLGTVLPTVGFGLGKQHNFSESETEAVKQPEKETVDETIPEEPEPPKVENVVLEPVVVEPEIKETKVEEVVEKEAMEEKPSDITTILRQCQEKATPNLSAWFKAFGTPKNGSAPKKKSEDTDQDEKATDTVQQETKVQSPKPDLPIEEVGGAEGSESPMTNMNAGSNRQRRTSTGSSISERSSFSQDLDSPRHQMSHSSPLLQSPASPRTEDFQKITYPIVNGTIRAGFYQDTTSIKSSPEKSCSPREAPQSPYSQLQQHVYATNNATNITSQTPNYFVDNHNKSPLPTYGQNQPPPYYDTSKAPPVVKPTRIHDDYTALGPDSPYQQPASPFVAPFSPSHSPYSPHSQHSPYSHVQNSPQGQSQQSPAPNTPATDASFPEKTALYPVKKRAYTEADAAAEVVASISTDLRKENLDIMEKTPNAVENRDKYPTTTTSLKPALKETITISNNTNSSKTVHEPVNMSGIHQKPSDLSYLNLQLHGAPKTDDRPKHKTFDKLSSDSQNDLAIDMIKMNAPSRHVDPKISSVDMINMGYFNPEMDVRNTRLDTIDLLNLKDLNDRKLNVSAKMYDMAMNLGMNSSVAMSTITSKSAIGKTPISNPISMSQAGNMLPMTESLVQAIYGTPSTSDLSSVVSSNYSRPELDFASKKSYAGQNTTNTTTDFANWKTDVHVKKLDLPNPLYVSAFPGTNMDHNNITKGHTSSVPSTSSIQFSKISQSQLPAYTSTRTASVPRNNPQTQSELRIPNPRGILNNLKNPDPLNDLSAAESEIIKNTDTLRAVKNLEKSIQNLPLVNTLQYKSPPYAGHSSTSIDPLRNIPNLPQMLDKYTSDERFLSTFQTASGSLYHDKTLQMAQMFNKNASSYLHTTSAAASLPIFSHASMSAALAKDNSPLSYKVSNVTHSQASPQVSSHEGEKKTRCRKKKAASTPAVASVANPTFHQSSSVSDALSSAKSSVVPGSAFNFGPSPNAIGLTGGLYGDNASFLEEFRNTTANQFMAANYMAAAAAAHQRTSVESAGDKLAKPAHQNSAHAAAGSFPFMGHGQVRAGYPFDAASAPIYRQYFQRHQEELLRQTGAQMMGLYPPPGYPAGLRQPFDSIDRPSWL